MAAYAALVSLMHLLDQILHPAQRRIFFDEKQIAYLREHVLYLQEFLENHDSSQERTKEIERLESGIVSAARGAEDTIESLVLDQISTGYRGREEECSTLSSQNIQRVTEEIDCIKKEVMAIEDRKGFKDQQNKNLVPAVSSTVIPSGKNSTMVGFDEYLIQIMDRLTAKQSNRQIIAIVGMGGIGKTTLARNVYENPCIVHHFDIQAWVIISQEHNVRTILLCLLHELGVKTDKRRQESSENFEDFLDKMRQASDEQLGEKMHKSLSGMRYLIVMDDLWSTEAWDEIKMFFPDNCNGSRIMVTSRLSNVAVQMGSCSPYEIDFLDSDKSWNLLCEKVFPGQVPPLELAGIGHQIAEGCRGLPLAIVVISGLLAKGMTREHWEYVAENITSVVNSENDQHFLRILSLSYTQLPIHLKPCFLYMAAFPEDRDVHMSRLIRLWVAEGFVKPIRYKSLEEVAEEYLQDLIDRNLILVTKRGFTGQVKSCSIHDLLRDLCLKEAQKEKFLVVTKLLGLQGPKGMENERRICIHKSNRVEYYLPQGLHALSSASFARSLVCSGTTLFSTDGISKFRFLRVLDSDTFNKFSIEEVLQLVNSRHLAFMIHWDSVFIPRSIFLLWNLQTLIVRWFPFEIVPTVIPSEILQMPTLRHVEIKTVAFPDLSCAPINMQDPIVLENLHTFFTIVNFQCSEDILKIIPNVKKLKILYPDALEGGKEWSYYCLNNLVYLSKLETLNWTMPDAGFLGRFALPHSLKRLTLFGCEIPWEDMTIVGSLPNLEVLKLKLYAFEGPEWEPNEGEFPRLKFLLIEKSYLVHWRAGRTNFPSLESLVIRSTKLEEIPWGIGDIPTLRFIQLDYCTDSAISSAKQIQEDQESLGNYCLVVKIRVRKNWELQSLESDNFHVQVDDY